MNKRIRSIYTLAAVTSLQGFILLAVSVAYLLYITYKVILIESTLSTDPSSYLMQDVETTFRGGPLFLLLSLLVTTFIGFNLLVGLILRRNIVKQIKLGAYFENTQKRLKLDLKRGYIQLFLFARVRLHMSIESEDNKKVSFENEPVGYLYKNSILFNISHLPAGRYIIEKLTLTIGDPFNLLNIGSEITLEQPYHLQINNRFKISNIFFSSQSLNSKEGKELIYGKNDDSFFNIREYIKGDSLKKIHWKNSAKSRKFYVRVPEERFIEYINVDIVINMYVPYLNEVDYGRYLGDYLSIVNEVIKRISSDPGFKSTIYINSKEPLTISDINPNSNSYLEKQLNNKVTFQSSRTLKSFTSQYKFNNPIILSIPLDESLIEEPFVKGYIVNLNKDLQREPSKLILNAGLQDDNFIYHKPITIKRILRFIREMDYRAKIKITNDKIISKLSTNSKITFINAD